MCTKLRVYTSCGNAGSADPSRHALGLRMQVCPCPLSPGTSTVLGPRQSFSLCLTRAGSEPRASSSGS